MIDRSQYTDEERELIDARMCVCGCGASVRHRGARSIYISESHRQRRYRRKLKAAAKAVGLPATLSLQTVDTASTTSDRHGDAPAARRRRQSKPRPGVSVYLPTLGHAEVAQRLIAESADARALLGVDCDEITAEVAEAITVALERRRKRAA